MTVLPVCSATSSCSSHSQIPLHGGLHACSSFQKDLEARYIVEYRGSVGLSSAMHFQRDSFKSHATKSSYSNFVKSTEQSVSMNFVNRTSCLNESDYLHCKYSDMWSSSTQTIYEQHLSGRVELKYVESSSLLAPDEGLVDCTNQATENANMLSGPVGPETISATDLTPEISTTVSDSVDLATVKTSIEDFIDGVSKSFSASVDKEESSVRSLIDAITSSVSSVVKSADNAVGRVFFTINKTGQLGGTKMTNFSSDFKEATSKGTVIAIDVLRHAIVVVEDSLSNGASFVVNYYQSAKDFLPSDISEALNLSEKRAAEFLGPASTAFQQVYIAVEGLEENLGLDPNDPIIPIVLFLGTSATLWVIYRVRTYSGYAGDLSPQSTLELLTGKENAVLIDVRPEGLRETEGIPDLRQAARFRYASVTLPEVDAAVWKLLKSGRDLDNTLTAAVIWNLKIVQTIYQRVASYESAEDFKQDVRLLLAPVRLGAEAFSWSAGKLESNGIELPTAPSSSDVKNRVLQAAAKHESQPADT